MISIRELLNKIKYSLREKPEDYVLFYYDRVEDKLKELKLVDVERVEEGFLVLVREGKEVQIPLHRIKRVKKAGEIIWER
jgi:uncharacterized protein (UPF0248 family)